MNRSNAIALAGCLALCAPCAQAFTCYTLYDRHDNVVYRDAVPPVDMSQDGDAQREAMRRSGQYLLFVDSDQCPPVEYKFGESGSTTLSVENVIGGLRPMTIVRPGLPASATPPSSPAASAARARR